MYRDDDEEGGEPRGDSEKSEKMGGEGYKRGELLCILVQH